MSGGSYDYLYMKEVAELLENDSELQEMSDRLAGLGYAKDAAIETQTLILTLRQFKNRIDAITLRLGGVWRAVEMWDSCDSSEVRVHEALKAYRGEE